jgi:hypothetical protein
MFPNNNLPSYKTRKVYTERIQAFESTTPGFVERIKEESEVLSTFTEAEINTINESVLRDRQINPDASSTSREASAALFQNRMGNNNVPNFRAHVTTINKSYERDRR